jgi:hypothetical protein
MGRPCWGSFTARAAFTWDTCEGVVHALVSIPLTRQDAVCVAHVSETAAIGKQHDSQASLDRSAPREIEVAAVQQIGFKAMR